MSSGLFKILQPFCLQIMYLIYKQDLALNNLQWLICYKIQPTKLNQTNCS